MVMPQIPLDTVITGRTPCELITSSAYTPPKKAKSYPGPLSVLIEYIPSVDVQ